MEREDRKMEKRRRGILILVVVGSLFLLLLICLLARYLTGPKKVAGPLVTILSPHHGEQVRVREVVAVHSTSSDEVNKVVKVELWADGELIEVDTHTEGVEAFSLVQGWQPLSPGSHTLIVRAFNGADVHGQATIGLEAVEVPPEAVAEREPLPLPGELPPIEEVIESGEVPPGADVPPPPGGFLPAEEVPPPEEVPPTEEVPPEEVPVVWQAPLPEVVYTPPDPDPGSPPEDIGDLIAQIPIGVIAHLPPREVAPILVEFEAVEFAVDEDYNDVYCYVSLADEPVERVPEIGFFRPAGERQWDIAEHLGGENSRIVEMPPAHPLRVFVECYGWVGDTHEYLGVLDVLHPSEDWDGHLIHARGTGGEGFRLAYRINPVPSIIPAPYNLVYASLGERFYLNWRWDGNEAEIDGFRVYRNDNLIASVGADFQGLEVSTWTTQHCGGINEFYVTAYRGEFGEGLESLPSNLVAFAGPPCEEVDDILSVEELPTPLCSGIHVVDIQYRYGSDHGDRVWIGAWPLGPGGSPFGGCSKDLIEHGEGVARMNLEYPGGGRVESAQLWVSMWDLEDNTFYSEVVDLPIVWNEDRPDLVITDAEIDCDALFRRVEIQNVGCGRVESDEVFLKFVSADGASREGSLPISVSLGPGEKYEWRYRTGVPPGREEEWRQEWEDRWGKGFVVTVDPDNLIAETNEENNSYIVIPFEFEWGGKKVCTSVPIFGEPDTDGDGINDNWEMAAVKELNPYIELDEEEDLIQFRDDHPNHTVANFVRVTPYPSKENPKYILFYYMVTWTRDYGRFSQELHVEAHNGDVERIIMAWGVLNNNCMKLDWVFTSAHGAETAHHGVWSPWAETCNEGKVLVFGVAPPAGSEKLCAKLQFRENRLKVVASEDVHAIYPTCRVCEDVVLVRVLALGTEVASFFSDLANKIWDGICSLWNTCFARGDNRIGSPQTVVLGYNQIATGEIAPVVFHQPRDSKYTLYWHINATTFRLDTGGGDRLAVGDVARGDGIDEIVLADDSDGYIHIFDMYGRLINRFYNAGGIGDIEANEGLAVGDVNGDGRDEIIHGDRYDDRIYVFDANGNLLNRPFNVGYEQEDRLAVGDVARGDGIDEIVLADDSDGYIHIFDMYGRLINRFYNAGGIGDIEANEGLAVGDVNGDGRDEIIHGDRYDDRIYVFDANGNLLNRPFDVGYEQEDELAAGDVNGDGIDEIILGDASDERIRVFDMEGRVLKEFRRDFADADSLAVGDVNGDGKDEIIHGDYDANRIHVLPVYLRTEDLSHVRIILDVLHCNDDQDWEMEWGSDEPYLIVIAFSLSPEANVRLVEENPTVDDDVDSGEDCEDIGPFVVFEGQFSEDTVVGFTAILMESEDDGGRRRGLAGDIRDKLEEELYSAGEAEVGGCKEALFRRALTGKIGEDCSGKDLLYRFPAYNIGEPDHLWITDLTPYGFPGESVEGRDYNGEKRFCGGLECGEAGPKSILENVREPPDLLTDKLGQ